MYYASYIFTLRILALWFSVYEFMDCSYFSYSELT